MAMLRPAAPTPPPVWEAQVMAFLRGKKADVNLSPATYTLYRSHLLGPRAVEWLNRNSIEGVADLTLDHVRDLRITLMEAGLKENSVHSAGRALKTFARWSGEQGQDVNLQVRNVKAPKSSQVIPETFNDAQLARLFAKVRSPRDAFLMELLLHTGVRLAEATGTVTNERLSNGKMVRKWKPGICLDDFHDGPDGQWVHVHGKGRKDRILPLDTPRHKLSKKLAAYLRTVRPKDTERRELFLSATRPRGEDYVPLTADAVKQLLSRIGEEAGVPHTHAHRFRHTYATRAHAAGLDVLSLQRALGHSTLAMTMRYVQFDSTTLLQAYGHRRD